MAKSAVKKPPTTQRPPSKPKESQAPTDRVAAIRAAAAKASPAPARTYLLVVSRHERGHRRFVRLKAPSVLAWFQRAWRETDEARLSELRGDVYGLKSFFEHVEELDLACPKTDAELVPLLEEHVYSEGGIEAEPHFLHVETDDDEGKIEYFFFDDAFLKAEDALDRLPSSRRPFLEEETEPPEDWEDERDQYAMFIDALTEERDE